MDIQAMKEKRKALLRQAQAILLGDGVTQDKIAEAKRMSVQADTLEDQIDAEERAGHGLYGVMPPRPQPGEYEGGPVSASGYEGRATSRCPDTPEKRAFEQYVRQGKGYESRDLEVGSTGAALVPQAFYPVLTEAKKAWGSILNIVNEFKTDGGAPMKVGYSDDTGTLAHLVGETGPVSEVDPSLSSILLNTDQCVTDMIKVTIAELQDSAFDIDKFVRDQFGKRYYRGLTSLITNGSWLGSPAVAQNIQSIVTGAAAGATSASATSIAYADIVALYGALDPAYIESASFVMNAKTRAKLLAITDSLGRPLYIPNPVTGAFDRLLGCPVVINQYMPDVAAGAVALQFGDFSQGYLLRTVKPGLAIARLNERFMDTLEVGFIGYFRAGGVVTDAGTHPIVNLTQKS